MVFICTYYMDHQGDYESWLTKCLVDHVTIPIIVHTNVPLNVTLLSLTNAQYFTQNILKEITIY